MTNKSIGLIVVIYLVILLLLSQNLNSPNLWLDESGQFWMSKGLNHYSAPMQETKGIISVIQENQKYNLDPGGFTVILHYWSKISNSHIWLRTLPFLFFLGTIYIFYLIAYSWTRNRTFSLLMCIIPTISPIIIQYAFEVRAYSMEYLGTAAAVLFVEVIRRNVNYRQALFWGGLMAFLLTSRYSLAIPIGVSSFVYLIIILKSDFKMNKKLLLLISYAVPIMISAALIYFLTLKHQNPSATPPAYINEITLKYGFGYIFKVRFLIPFCFLLAFILFYLLIKFRFKSIAERFSYFFWILIANNIIFIMLSLLGFYPYDFTSRWSISLHTFTLLSAVAFISIIFLFAYNRMQAIILERYLLALSIFVGFSIVGCFVFFKSIFKYREYESIYYPLNTINLEEYQNILVNKNGSSSVRYLFEYGALKNRYKFSVYPSRFTISPLNEINDINCLDEKFDLVILLQKPSLNIDTIIWNRVYPNAEIWRRKQKKVN